MASLRSNILRNCCVLRAVVQSNKSRQIIRYLHRKYMQRSVGSTVVAHIVSRPWQQYRHYTDYPDHVKVHLPALSPTMETGTIITWHKKEGDKLNEGDLLAEIETDKATMGFETPEEGYLAKILVAAGTKNVTIGKLVCIIVQEESSVTAFKDYKDDSKTITSSAVQSTSSMSTSTISTSPMPTVATASAATNSTTTSSVTPINTQSDGRIYASPLAKKLAVEKGFSLEEFKGTGLYGSVTSKDLAHTKSSTTATSATSTIVLNGKSRDVPTSNMRTIIAKRLLESKQSIPHYYLSADVQMDAALVMREKFNKMLEKDKVKLSLNDIIIKGIAMACKKVPEGNCAWMGDFIREYQTVDVSVAVSTDDGLITPIVFGADSKGILQISKDVKTLASKARDGKLQPHEFQGGTITLSNLGMFGVKNFSAIINPPQSIILAVGVTEPRLIPAKNEKGYTTAQFMSVTASCDHRTVDGAIGAQWLTAFKNFMENPTTMLL